MRTSEILLLAASFPVGLLIDVVAAKYAGAQSRISSAFASGIIAVAITAGAFFSPAANTTGLIFLTISLGWLLLAQSCIDLRTFRLPNILNAVILLLGILMVLQHRMENWPLHIAGAIIGYAMLWIVEIGYKKLRNADGIGRGDAKLLGAIGMWTGALYLPLVLLIASLSGIIAALFLALIRREALSGQSAIAFGPWIALGGYFVWLTAPFLMKFI